MLARGAALASFLALHLAAQSAPPPVPIALRKQLETVAQNLLKSGWVAESALVVNVLQDLGHEPAAITTLRAALVKLQPKAPKTPAGGDKLAPAVEKVAAALAALLPAAAGDQQAVLARAIVALDDDVAEAQRALGRVEHGGRWISVENAERAKRRDEIRRAIATAQRLPVAPTVTRGEHPLYAEALKLPSVRVQCGPVTFESDWPVEKATRVVQATMRALAISQFLAGGKLEIPGKGTQRVFHLQVGNKARYEQAVAWLQQRGDLQDMGIDPLKVAGAFTKSGQLLHWHLQEAHAEAVLLYKVLEQDHHAWVLAGHVNWLCRAFFGEPIPSITYSEGTVKASSHTGTAAEQQEREWKQHLGRAGLLGARSWLAYLAERSQDPPYARCFADEVGKLRGDELLKATFACELLHESGVFAKLWPLVASRDFPRALQDATGLTVDAFDLAFREWIVGPRPGVAQVLATDRSLPADVTAALGKLVALRRSALATQPWSVAPRPDPRVDGELSAGARRHAEYLAKHPEQAAAWPDAHEEYPDREGFSAEGAWAGGHSVIAPGAKSLNDAIDAWMGTFYHRLPLLEPGLMQCGMALAGGIAVLDASSMVVPLNELQMAAIWPPADARNVPLRFVPELPDPLPGADQSKAGYPITLQCSEWMLEDGDVTMTLHEGSATGAPVACHWSTPTAPTNPLLAPASAWCLIPKAPLSPNKKYTVVCKLGRDALEWSFQTGAK